MCWLAPEPEETYGLLDPVVRSRRGSGVDLAEPPGAHECHRRRYENRTPAGPARACAPGPASALRDPPGCGRAGLLRGRRYQGARRSGLAPAGIPPAAEGNARAVPRDGTVRETADRRDQR